MLFAFGSKTKVRQSGFGFERRSDEGSYRGKELKGKAFPFNNLSKADYLPAAEPRKKQNRSPAKRVRFWKEEPRSTDEKKATAYAIAFFEPCGVNSDVEAPPRFELGQSRICSPLPYHLAMAPDIGKEGFSQNPLFFLWSGLRGSNSLPPPWQGGALPDELKPQNGASGQS